MTMAAWPKPLSEQKARESHISHESGFSQAHEAPCFPGLMFCPAAQDSMPPQENVLHPGTQGSISPMACASMQHGGLMCVMQELRCSSDSKSSTAGNSGKENVIYFCIIYMELRVYTSREEAEAYSVDHLLT